MGSELAVYFRLGIEHITDIRGYDHILFIAALTVAYSLLEWRRLLILVTAFTLGHSITLALATAGAVSVNTELIEFLIPATILITSVFNVADSRSASEGVDAGNRARRHQAILYILAGGFGLPFYIGNIYGSANAARKWNLSVQKESSEQIYMTLGINF